MVDGTLSARFPYLDVENSVAAMGGSEFLYEKTLKQAIRFIPRRVTEMDAAFSGDMSEFRVRIHGMKGVFRQIGHTRLAERAELLERAERICCDYPPFRQELLDFYEQAESLLNEPEKSEALELRSLGDYRTVLDKVIKAAEDYDTIAATELLEPLVKLRFGAEHDAVLRKALEALEAFQPEQALIYLDGGIKWT